MEYIKVTFNEDTWTVYLIDKDDHVVSDADAAAEVLFEQKEIYFRRNELRLNVVLHELWHVYFGYCYLDSAGVSWNQAEEVSASLFADKGSFIVSKGLSLYKQLCDLRDSTAVKDDEDE